MKKYILTILSIVSLCLTSCDDILDRPSETSYTDDNFWTTEEQ